MRGQIEAAGVFFKTRRQVAGLLMVLGIILMTFTYFGQYSYLYYIWTVLGIIIFLIGIYLLVRK